MLEQVKVFPKPEVVGKGLGRCPLAVCHEKGKYLDGHPCVARHKPPITCGKCICTLTYQAAW